MLKPLKRMNSLMHSSIWPHLTILDILVIIIKSERHTQYPKIEGFLLGLRGRICQRPTNHYVPLLNELKWMCGWRLLIRCSFFLFYPLTYTHWKMINNNYSLWEQLLKRRLKNVCILVAIAMKIQIIVLLSVLIRVSEWTHQWQLRITIQVRRQNQLKITLQ